MEQLGEILRESRINNAINVNKNNNLNNDNNDTSREYSLNRSKFTPNTEESQLAEEMANYFDDLDNFAFYFKVVKKLGVFSSRVFFKSHLEEEKEKKGTKFEFRSSKKFFAWKFKRGIF